MSSKNSKWTPLEIVQSNRVNCMGTKGWKNKWEVIIANILQNFEREPVNGLYYLQSRYYNPEIGRFINRDDSVYHNGMTGVEANLYAYCGNNPIMMSDPSGMF